MCPSDRRLYRAIRRGMFYWYARLILGLGTYQAGAIARQIQMEKYRLTRNLVSNAWKRRMYARYRAEGASWAEAKGRLAGIPASVIRAKNRASSRSRRIRYGGDASHMGSPAWHRWMMDRLTRAEGSEDQ